MLATIIGLVDFPYLDSILDSMIYSEFPPCLRLLPFFSTNVRISWLQMGPHSVGSRGCSDGSHTFRESTTLLGTVITVVPGSGMWMHRALSREMFLLLILRANMKIQNVFKCLDINGSEV